MRALNRARLMPVINGTYAEPWVSFVLPSHTTISVSAESVYDWNGSDLALPINLIVDQLITIWDQPIFIGATAKQTKGQAFCHLP